MMYLIAALLFYTVAILLGAFASRRADTNLVTGLTNAVSAILPLLTVAAFALQKKVHPSSQLGLAAALGGGVAIALFAMAFTKALSSDKVAIATPVVFGGAIILSSILSWWLFRERLTPVQAGGLALMTVGLGMIIFAKATGR